MAKNNKLIDTCNRLLSDKISQILPCAFCSFLVVLYEEYGWSTDQLEELLNRVQARYDELEEMGNKQMNTYCEERTGITLIPNKDR